MKPPSQFALDSSSSLTLLTPAPQLSSQATRAHALKNCLSVVLAVNALVAPEVSSRSRGRLARAREAAIRMIGILEEGLEVERRACPALQPCFVSSGGLFRIVCERVEDCAASRDVELVVRAAGGGVHGHPEELAEALGNILLNAIQATPPMGRVHLTAEETPAGDQLWTVKDTGPGIPRAALANVGTPSCTHREGGWGLGFAVVLAVVEKHGGVARIESSVGRGTLVTLWLPGRSEETRKAEAEGW